MSDACRHDAPPDPALPGALVALFVYGSLRHGTPAHGELLGGRVVRRDAAAVRGSVRRDPDGWPILVPAPDLPVMAGATHDPARDVARQLLAQLLAPPAAPAAGPEEGDDAHPLLEGDLLWFTPAGLLALLPLLDAYEPTPAAAPPGAAAPYARVLLPVVARAEGGGARVVPAWCYAAAEE